MVYCFAKAVVAKNATAQSTSSPGEHEDKMKNITKPLRFLEAHIDLILVLFFPAWFGILFMLGAVLNLLPEEIAEKVSPDWVDTALMVLTSLVVCAVIAICRMIRDIKEWKPMQSPFYLFLLAMDILITFFIFKMSVAMQCKIDNANISSNLSQISKGLYMYEMGHGSYPPQQDMKSLLETLEMNDSVFIKTRFYDIYSAEYHAPAVDSNDPNETIITIRTKWFVPEGDAGLLFLRRDGSVGIEHLKDIASRPEPKQEKESKLLHHSHTTRHTTNVVTIPQKEKHDLCQIENRPAG